MTDETDPLSDPQKEGDVEKPMTATHIVSSFDDDLNKVESLVIEMGGLVEYQLSNAISAMMKSDVELASKVIGGDGQINALEAEINALAIRVLALRQPVAQDLRSMVMTLKIASHLERMGDYAKNIARRANTITRSNSFYGSLSTLTRMADLVENHIKLALDAYINRDAEAAELVRTEDEKVDLLHNSLFRELLTYMMEDPSHIGASMHLLFIAKNIERMGDHAVSIAQEVIFLVTGSWPEDKRPKGDKTSRMIFTAEELEEMK
ncbi:phosphate signaling complex protein PhoU [Robiginitomaculum antarcticum]|uniref:phosphate signaling complex protein PhoU n=1 Tax=Robiginitomaculum antarcticum TaxID=437507 RepID=UPI00037E7ADC|nr:phosphate signaling complex protein PhoU [Robiginitomaculum antarcticum]